MSIPKNHHYVSQCHIENFFDKKENKIFCYDKQRKNFYQKFGSKGLFSEKYANSRIINNEVDHKGLEDELNHFYENNFYEDFSNLLEVSQNDKLFSIKKKHLSRLARFAIISFIRHPDYKASVDSQISDVIRNKIKPYATPELASQLEESFFYEGKTNYSNTISYIELADRIFSFMEPVNYTIVKILTNEFFILPDKYALINRVSYAPDSLGMVVALVGIPLSSKVFLSVESKLMGNSKDKVIKIKENNSDIVRMINEDLYKRAFRTIVCENETYLQDFINKQNGR